MIKKKKFVTGKPLSCRGCLQIGRVIAQFLLLTSVVPPSVQYVWVGRGMERIARIRGGNTNYWPHFCTLLILHHVGPTWEHCRDASQCIHVLAEMLHDLKGVLRLEKKNFFDRQQRHSCSKAVFGIAAQRYSFFFPASCSHFKGWYITGSRLRTIRRARTYASDYVC